MRGVICTAVCRFEPRSDVLCTPGLASPMFIADQRIGAELCGLKAGVAPPADVYARLRQMSEPLRVSQIPGSTRLPSYSLCTRSLLMLTNPTTSNVLHLRIATPMLFKFGSEVIDSQAAVRRSSRSCCRRIGIHAVSLLVVLSAGSSADLSAPLPLPFLPSASSLLLSVSSRAAARLLSESVLSAFASAAGLLCVEASCAPAAPPFADLSGSSFRAAFSAACLARSASTRFAFAASRAT